MNKLFLLLLICIFSDLSGQSIIDFQQGKEFYNSIDFANSFSFDSTEIKARKFRTATVIFAQMQDEEDNLTHIYNDTVEIYKFDSNGRISELTSQQRGKIDWIARYDEHGEIIDDSTEKMTTSISGESKIIKRFYIYMMEGKPDTSITWIYTYNEKDLLIEEQKITSPATLKETGCLNGATLHIKYNYDENGRLIRFQNLKLNQYVKISHPAYGKFVEWREAVTDSLMASEMVLINRTGGVTSYSNSNTLVTVSLLEEKSKLPYKILIIGIQAMPSFEEYTIRYSEK